MGCQKYYLSVQKQSLDVSPASNFARTPNLEKAEKGEELIIEWRVTKEQMTQPLRIVVKVLYRNYEESTKHFPVDRKRGVVTFPLKGDAYEKTKGFLSYMVTLETTDGVVVKEWKQQLYVDLIKIE